MKNKEISRRQFIRSTACAGTGLLLSSTIASASDKTIKRTAVDQVTLGKTGLKASRLGIGTGTNAGIELARLGQQHFNDLIHHAYDSGITSIDTAQIYQTFGMLKEAIKDLPREKLFIQSKIAAKPEDVLAAIDAQRKALNCDYIDSLLIHNMVTKNWTDDWKRAMDGFNEAQSRKWIRSKGVSCHTLGALNNATVSDWPDVHLVRINPQGNYVDATTVAAPKGDPATVVKEINSMHEKQRGVIGMKIFGNGEFKSPQDREKSVRFAMTCKGVDAIMIGFLRTRQIDDAVGLINRVLADLDANS